MSLASLPDKALVEIVEQVWLPLVVEYAGHPQSQN
jgi:hypothetical protein